LKILTTRFSGNKRANNGDTYYKIQYPEHNLVRTKAQFKLLQSVEAHRAEMREYVEGLVG
jgi:hypothetical protein